MLLPHGWCAPGGGMQKVAGAEPGANECGGCAMLPPMPMGTTGKLGARSLSAADTHAGSWASPSPPKPTIGLIIGTGSLACIGGGEADERRSCAARAIRILWTALARIDRTDWRSSGGMSSIWASVKESSLITLRRCASCGASTGEWALLELLAACRQVTSARTVSRTSSGCSCGVSIMGGVVCCVVSNGVCDVCVVRLCGVAVWCVCVCVCVCCCCSCCIG